MIIAWLQIIFLPVHCIMCWHVSVETTRKLKLNVLSANNSRKGKCGNLTPQNMP
ncbi:hypothetical protein BDV32DRAFT_119510 [Aspergillus pseudonomiae]|uniref:Uncharacterized protein n=1 Tax=Aspergillus pseudonomiae TaxID=1506151 RepID=A0A5N6IAA7_9EURO|nr:uncharacterized protein BDV37DRAFT_265143 [Aspergillus pseudonomiae]KAB8263184.1 hypothetical protein BDV32DRAFT_119510 [Aspergillus pseudonomiae]KAE8397677.1 hypothetical protein BDV37DRAFT_265143 [Aspergillus pseudonomiae]